MQSETALTILCSTTIFIIVGMVMLTAMHIGIEGAAITDTTGNYVAIGTSKSIARGTFIPVEVSPRDPFCFQNAVAECKRVNSGVNFVKCTDKAMYACGKAPLTAYCILPAGYELKYTTRDACLRQVLPECRVRCARDLINDCVSISKGRCRALGSRYTLRYQAERYARYPQLDFGLV